MWNLFSLKDRLRAFAARVVDAEMQRWFSKVSASSAWQASRTAQQHVESLTARIDKLERLLTEHANVATGDIDISGFASPAVSVILPTWNRARIVGAAIRSVQAQVFADWELIVVDDGSEDDTADVIAAFAADSRIRYVRLAHAGQCEARNHGQSIARGALVAYIDSDNLWYPEFLAAAVNLMTYRPEVLCAYGAMVSDTHVPRILFEPFDRDRLLAGNYIDTSTFIHRRDLIARYGGFDPAASPMEDWDLILRYTVDSPACPLPVLAVRYRNVDSIRVSDTQDKKRPIETIQQKWTIPHASPGPESKRRHGVQDRL